MIIGWGSGTGSCPATGPEALIKVRARRAWHDHQFGLAAGSCPAARPEVLITGRAQRVPRLVADPPGDTPADLGRRMPGRSRGRGRCLPPDPSAHYGRAALSPDRTGPTRPRPTSAG